MLLNYTQNLSYIQDARSAMNNALMEWQTSFNITFIETTDIEKADIKLSFHTRNHGDNYNFDGHGGILAHAYYPYENKYLGVIHMDADEVWNYNFLYCVILHELGHTFGLGHTSVKKAVMAPFYYGTSKLHEDDRNGIGDLYGLKSKYGPITPYNNTTPPTHPTHPTRPTHPTHPTHPTRPTRPTRPTHPTHPTHPTRPTRPTRPTHPTRPFETHSKSNSTYKQNYRIYREGKTINIYNSHVQIM
ncbi:MAG: matrixin family metalloprotease [Cetobacterium sp.]